MYQKNKSVGAGEITKEEVAGNVGSILAIINRWGVLCGAQARSPSNLFSRNKNGRIFYCTISRVPLKAFSGKGRI